jgi:hypothetical protein
MDNSGVTPPPWAFGIIELGQILDLIYGLQSLKGKILSRKELAAENRVFKELCSLLSVLVMIFPLVCGRQGQMSHDPVNISAETNWERISPKMVARTHPARKNPY